MDGGNGSRRFDGNVPDVRTEATRTETMAEDRSQETDDEPRNRDRVREETMARRNEHKRFCRRYSDGIWDSRKPVRDKEQRKDKKKIL